MSRQIVIHRSRTKSDKNSALASVSTLSMKTYESLRRAMDDSYRLHDYFGLAASPNFLPVFSLSSFGNAIQ